MISGLIGSNNNDRNKYYQWHYANRGVIIRYPPPPSLPPAVSADF